MFISKPNKNSVNNVGVPSLANTAPKKFDAATKTIIKAVISKVLTSASCSLDRVNFLYANESNNAPIAPQPAAAGCGAMGALLLSLAYKKLTLSKLQEALVKTLEITALIMVLVAASNFFGAVFARLGTPTLLTEFLLGLEMNKYFILAIVMVAIFLLGWPT